MIVVDTSALIAILDGEADAAQYAEAIAEAEPPLISAAAVIEAGIVMINRHGPKGLREVGRLIQEAGFQVQEVTARHAQIALEALFVRQGPEECSRAELRGLLFIRARQGNGAAASF